MPAKNYEKVRRGLFDSAFFSFASFAVRSCFYRKVRKVFRKVRKVLKLAAVHTRELFQTDHQRKQENEQIDFVSFISRVSRAERRLVHEVGKTRERTTNDNDRAEQN